MTGYYIRIHENRPRSAGHFDLESKPFRRQLLFDMQNFFKLFTYGMAAVGTVCLIASCFYFLRRSED